MGQENKSIGERGSGAYLKLSEYAQKLKLKNSGYVLDGFPAAYTLTQAKVAIKRISELDMEEELKEGSDGNQS